MNSFEENLNQEIRFAVVMYGGVSLAIYINGVSQELYRLVASTAEGWPVPESGTGKIYRELAEKLKARFVIDILSGTSAGGINAVFLAKALANGQKIDQLEALWLGEADIDKLLNDKRTPIDILQTDFTKPRSLLNSRKMYGLLVDAFNKMDKTTRVSEPETSPQSLVEELDLFVTATDLQGQKTSLRLADGVVDERRHRHVFKFKFRKETGDNDFKKENNPFLAFASRCTSSFPFAFEPMCLNDITGSRLHREWEKFYQDYLLDGSQIKPETTEAHSDAIKTMEGKYDTFRTRAFADGGYLDNKPFSHAIQTIGQRRSKIPVDRKLIYVEPSPEHLPDELTVDPPPNAFENTLKALSLARYETIKEDLELVTARNRMIEKLRRILDGTLHDIQINEDKSKPDSVDNWLGTSLNEMINKEGIAYGGYIRLRVSILIEDLAEIVASQAGFDVHSDLCHAISLIVRAWCESRFDFHAADEGQEKASKWCDFSFQGGPKAWKMKSYNRFLYCFDISFFIRRLNFTITNIDRLYRMAGKMEEVPKVSVKPGAALENPYEAVRRVTQKGPDAIGDFRKRLSDIRDKLSYRLAAIHKLRAGLLKPDEDSALTRKIKSLNLDSRLIISEILGASSRKDALERAGRIVADESALNEVAMIINAAVVKANLHSHLCKHELRLGTFFRPGDPNSKDVALESELHGLLAGKDLQDRTDIELKAIPLPEQCPPNPIDSATWVAAYYFNRFPHYDLVAFPILQSSGIGEELDVVDIIRISPEDANLLSDAGERKLGGTTIMHFGAFFDRTWRKNDILWGRLDGAERIISSLLSGTELEPKKKAYIERAHKAILEETFIGNPDEKEKGERRGPGRDVLDLLTAAVLGKNNRERRAVDDQMLKGQTRKEIQNMIDKVLKGNLEVEGLYETLFKDYEADRNLNPETALKVIARSTKLTGKILDGLCEDQDRSSAKKKAAIWTIRIGRLLWGLVEVAIPQSLLGAFIRYWISLLLVISGLLIVLGPMIAGGDGSVLQRFGFMLLFIVVLFYTARSILRKVIFKKFRYLRLIKNVFISVLTILILIVLGIGVFYFPEAWQSFLTAL